MVLSMVVLPDAGDDFCVGLKNALWQIFSSLVTNYFGITVASGVGKPYNRSLTSYRSLLVSTLVISPCNLSDNSVNRKLNDLQK